MTPEEFVERVGRTRVTAILRTDTQEKARNAMAAAVRGGFKNVEFTMTVPGVLELIEEFAAKPDLIVGAGTVLTPAHAGDAVRAGARFLVSPVMDEAVVACAHALGVAIMPGTHTATDMWKAHQAGAQFCKLFPPPAGGPAYVRSILGPMPFLKIVPTSGVDLDNFEAWIDAGAYGAGFVASLFRREDVDAGNWDAIEARARDIVARAGVVGPVSTK